jgi:hypothetical protein
MVLKESQIFKMIGKLFLKWYDGGGENRLTQKKEFEVKMFFSSKDFHPYPHVKLFGTFFPSLKIWGENKLQFSFQMDWKWVHLDYGCGGVMKILTVDAYPAMDLCTPILFGWD